MGLPPISIMPCGKSANQPRGHDNRGLVHFTIMKSLCKARHVSVPLTILQIPRLSPFRIEAKDRFCAIGGGCSPDWLVVRARTLSSCTSGTTCCTTAASSAIARVTESQIKRIRIAVRLLDTERSDHALHQVDIGEVEPTISAALKQKRFADKGVFDEDLANASTNQRSP